MRAKVSRKGHFNAAHRLHNPRWSAAENQRVFGLCNNPNYHGHNYEIMVTVAGPIDPDTGFVMDLKKLKDLIEERVETYLDHKNLNLDVPEFENLNPTAEHIAVIIWNRLRPHIDPALSLEVELQETPQNIVSYNGI